MFSRKSKFLTYVHFWVLRVNLTDEINKYPTTSAFQLICGVMWKWCNRCGSWGRWWMWLAATGHGKTWRFEYQIKLDVKQYLTLTSDQKYRFC